MVSWALILILVGHSLGSETSTELSHLPHTTESLESHEIAIKIDGEEGIGTAPGARSQRTTNLATTENPPKEISLVGSKITDDSTEESSQKLEDCPICLDKCSEPYPILKCTHSICTPCINPWLKIKPRCPVCQAELDHGVVVSAARPQADESAMLNNDEIHNAINMIEVENQLRIDNTNYFRRMSKYVASFGVVFVVVVIIIFQYLIPSINFRIHPDGYPNYAPPPGHL
ncbi:uncharacterized protein PGTG_19298 [Puccinia graminis f. sp. tritici CRL 75-36-700-3]|uniref:RING-type domain-containing protein n=1 Tax=Puccinia graminis f. sp. tritici (strain CRL 75-36-700-3 / race SCCL) TaxID=418459 RepID=E3L9W8_PUCGT|nr:uncharacterized protein PGTG_19298 [Puccinia graminis f. sp. tritici CRL 75-36-700-3]EFP93343.2 hypothetical protein PGTG_19298 [Puccinia graminis f. sp. tritici CRL 75-36-700-3]